MTGVNGSGGCARTSWIVAAIIGVIAFVLLIIAADWRMLTALIAGLLLFVVLGFLFSRLLCGESASSAAPVATSAPAHKPQATAAPAATVSATPPSAPVSPADPDTVKGGMEPVSSSEDARETSSVGAAEPALADSPDTIKPSVPLPGEAELAERKGTWTYKAPEAEPDTAAATSSADAAPDVAPQPASEPAAEPAPAPVAADPAPAPAADAQDVPLVKPSTPLAGEADLASRKGSWRYTPTAAAPVGEDYDRDGVIEGADEGEKPEMLSGPRDGGADDLKQIKGIGPKLERLCNSLGIYHFDQIAAWTDQEIAWVDANLEGFKGRVSRDEWVSQAQVLAQGGATEFSARVKGGDVY